MPCEVIDHIQHKAWQENVSTRLSILNCWREEIPDELVQPHNMPDPAEDDATPDDDSSYHPKDKERSLSSPHELDSESIAPIEASPAEPDLIDDLPTEGVEHDHDLNAIEPDDETIVTEPKVTHADESDLFVPVEAPANLFTTPHLSWAMKKLEIVGVAPPILEARTQSGKVLSTVASLQVDQDGLQKALVGVVMTQYHVQKGLRVFGEAGVVGVRKELQQLHDCKIPKPVHPEGLSKEQFTKVLDYLIFFKKNGLGLLKVMAALMVIHSISTLARQNQHLPPYSQSQSY